MKEREELFRDKEISSEGKNAEKEWKRKNWILRIAVCVLILSVLAFCFLPACVYRYGQYQMDRELYSDAAETFTWLHERMASFHNGRFPKKRYKDCAEKARECHYKFGLTLMEEEAYEQALAEFTLAGTYGDSATLAEKCEKLILGE